jgi:Na+-driven multidrug efflux pump
VCWALREAATSLVGNALAKRDGAEAADVVDASLTMALVLGSALAWTIHTHAGLLIGV